MHGWLDSLRIRVRKTARRILPAPIKRKQAGNSSARQIGRRPKECELLKAGTGVPRHMTLNPRMNQIPVPIERLEKDLGQPVVENERP